MNVQAPAAPRRRALEAAAVVSTALALRLAFIAVAAGPFNPKSLRNDAAQYQSYAVHMVEQGRYADDAGDLAFRMPGYPVLLALVYFAWGHASILPVLVLQALLGALACLALYAAAQKLYGRPWGLCCGIAAAISYDLIEPAGRILTESPSSALVCLFLALWFLAPWRPALLAAVLGALLGALTLIRAEFGFFAAAFFLLSPALAKAWRPRHAIAGAAVFAAFLSPWIVRNALVLQRFAPR